MTLPARPGTLPRYSDRDHYDAWTDDLATGDPYDPDYWPMSRPSTVTPNEEDDRA